MGPSPSNLPRTVSTNAGSEDHSSAAYVEGVSICGVNDASGWIARSRFSRSAATQRFTADDGEAFAEDAEIDFSSALLCKELCVLCGFPPPYAVKTVARRS